MSLPLVRHNQLQVITDAGDVEIDHKSFPWPFQTLAFYLPPGASRVPTKPPTSALITDRLSCHPMPSLPGTNVRLIARQVRKNRRGRLDVPYKKFGLVRRNPAALNSESGNAAQFFASHKSIIPSAHWRKSSLTSSVNKTAAGANGRCHNSLKPVLPFPATLQRELVLLWASHIRILWLGTPL